MKVITLVPKEQPVVGLQAEVITPEVFAGKRIKEIESLPIFCGNREAELGDFFDISGSVAEAPRGH